MANNYQTINDQESFKPQPTPKLVDEIMEEVGYGAYQVKIIIFAFTMITGFGIQITLMSSMYVPLKTNFQINDTVNSILSSSIFLGLAIGSILSTQVSNLFTRKNSIFYSNLILFIMTLGIAFTNLSAIFAVYRFMAGVLMGAVIPMIMACLTEYLPIKWRSYILVGVASGYPFGSVYTLCFMLKFTPNFEASGTRSIMILNSLPSLIAFIIGIYFFRESPRYLIIQEQDKEALDTIEDMKGKTLTVEERNQIVSEVREGANKNIGASLNHLFNNDYLKVTLIISFSTAISSFVLFGSMFIIQTTLDRIQKDRRVNKPITVITDQIIVHLIAMFGNIAMAYLMELKLLGRRYSIAITFLFSAICQSIACLVKSQFAIWYGFSNLFIAATGNMITAYASEIYPTVIKGTALGYFFFCLRFAAFLSQFAGPILENWKFLLMYYVCIALSLIGGLLISLSDVETLGKPIDYDMKDERNQKEKK